MRIAREAADWAAQIIVLIFATSTVAMPYVIPSASMESTLMTGDHVLVDKLAYAPHGDAAAKLLPYRDVHRGDIIVFRYPLNIKEDYVKRVIGVPGDRIHLIGGTVYVNGQPQTEPWAIHSDPDQRTPYKENFPNVPPTADDRLYDRWELHMTEFIQGEDLVVPPGNYFGMGDNRDVSYDSRYWGFIPRENVVGRPMFIYWSFQTPGDEYMRTGIGDRISFFFHILTHFFNETRWSRMLHLVR